MSHDFTIRNNKELALPFYFHTLFKILHHGFDGFSFQKVIVNYVGQSIFIGWVNVKLWDERQYLSVVETFTYCTIYCAYPFGTSCSVRFSAEWDGNQHFELESGKCCPHFVIFCSHHVSFQECKKHLWGFVASCLSACSGRYVELYWSMRHYIVYTGLKIKMRKNLHLLSCLQCNSVATYNYQKGSANFGISLM